MVTARQGAALLGISMREARLIWTRWQGRAFEQARCAAHELDDYCRSRYGRVPPLVAALLADERDWPRWLADLEYEWSVHSKRLAHTRKSGATRLAAASTWDEAVAIAETMPDLDARGRLDDTAVPSDSDLTDHWRLAGRFDDGTE